MHVLTKIFIVLVSLLAVLLVPLVVVYAHNENSFKARYQEAEAKEAVANQKLESAQAAAGADSTRLMNQVTSLQSERNALTNDKAAADATIRQLESQLATAQGMQSEINAKIATITETLKASHALTETLVNETRDLRASAVKIEQQKVELDEALRDVTTQLEVAEQARRALAEELARVKDEQAKTMAKLAEAVARGFGGDDVRTGAFGNADRIPDVTLTASIIRVQRGANETLAEINAGSKDGVKEGWVMQIHREGTYIANLRIINVDINRATGKVELENKARGEVQLNDKASTVAGQR